MITTEQNQLEEEGTSMASLPLTVRHERKSWQELKAGTEVKSTGMFPGFSRQLSHPEHHLPTRGISQSGLGPPTLNTSQENFPKDLLVGQSEGSGSSPEACSSETAPTFVRLTKTKSAYNYLIYIFFSSTLYRHCVILLLKSTHTLHLHES